MSENAKLFKKYGVSENSITRNILQSDLTPSKFDKYIKESSEKAFQEGFKPSEIAEFKRQHDKRLKQAQKNARESLKARSGMSEYRKKTKGKASDTGSEYRSGGRVQMKGGGCAKRGIKKNAYGKNS